jgi:hypothetical protein
MTSKNDVLTYFLMDFCQKSGFGATLPTLPLPLGFTAITDPPRVGEVRPGCGPQSGMAPVRIPIGFWSQAVENVRVAGSQSGLVSHSF